MKPIQGYDLVSEAGEFKSLPAGIYGVKITKVVDVPDKEYLEVYSDITKGEYKDYFKTAVENGLKDTSRCIRSYKSSALAFFKGFITAVEKTNPGYSWDWDEQKLVGKNVMAVVGEEEYIDDAGTVKTITKIVEFRSLQAFQEGKIKIPELRKLTDEDWAKWKAKHAQTEQIMQQTIEASPVIEDFDLPF